MDYTIKELPESERPREKLEDHGPQKLSDVELLSIILRTGTKGKNVKELSSEILNEHSLEEIADRGLDEMKKFNGISRVKAGQLLAVGELSRRLKKEEREKIQGLEDVKARTGDMKFMESEVLRVFYLNSGNELLAEEEFEGTVSEVGLNTREIFQAAMNCNATAIILSHNHPSGKASATEQDIAVTREIIELGEGLGVQVLDHVIVGEDFWSMRENSEVNF
ncbi:RadC family protein [Candidatus Nanohalovita haloferacivicina]|uniref:RadC family protein n=1 Tax=Candidatus Nanohalovita haloferacivicina TaxID=2978046 RepID=UPI00325F9DF4|nr:DNA repair protein RadC [Candidatus Nanohalobia archaeon BNXNv]